MLWSTDEVSVKCKITISRELAISQRNSPFSGPSGWGRWLPVRAELALSEGHAAGVVSVCAEESAGNAGTMASVWPAEVPC